MFFDTILIKISKIDFHKERIEINIIITTRKRYFSSSCNGSFLGTAVRPRDHDAVKNSQDVAKNPERPKQHSHGGKNAAA